MTTPSITSAKLREVASWYPGCPDWKAAILLAADEIDRLTAERNSLAAEMREALALNNEMKRLFDEACDERDRLTAALAPEYVRVRRDVAQLAALALSRLETYYVYEGEDGNGPPTLHEDKPVIAAVAHIRAALEPTP